MKKLLLKVLLLIFLVILILTLANSFFISRDDSHHNAAIIDKHKRLENIKSPKIVFVGGSNLTFGLDSKSIEETLGMRTVNMGLHADLGLRYELAEVEPYIKKGDVIVIIPEYEQFFGTCFDGGVTLTWMFFNFPESRKYLKSSEQYFSIFKNYPNLLRNSMFSFFARKKEHSYVLSDDVYYRNAFNEYGDIVVHLNKKRQIPGKIKSFKLEGDINRDVIPELNNFKAYAEKNGARVFLIHPCLMDIAYKKSEEKINLLHDIMKTDLKIQVLSVPMDYVFSESYFYNSMYHLTGEGREIRTQKIIASLKKTLY
jgi:hypothetical protein